MKTNPNKIVKQQIDKNFQFLRKIKNQIFGVKFQFAVRYNHRIKFPSKLSKDPMRKTHIRVIA
jgi:hypothetical protein